MLLLLLVATSLKPFNVFVVLQQLLLAYPLNKFIEIVTAIMCLCQEGLEEILEQQRAQILEKLGNIESVQIELQKTQNTELQELENKQDVTLDQLQATKDCQIQLQETMQLQTSLMFDELENMIDQSERHHKWTAVMLQEITLRVYELDRKVFRAIVVRSCVKGADCRTVHQLVMKTEKMKI
jgi:hypothetical protein